MTIIDIFVIIFFATFMLHCLGLLILIEYGWIYHPKDIYDNSNLNIFGAILLWFLWLVFCPIYAIIGFMIWLCTVGRKK